VPKPHTCCSLHRSSVLLGGKASHACFFVAAAVLLIGPPTSCPGLPAVALSHGSWPPSCADTPVNQPCTATCSFGGTASVLCLPSGAWDSTITGSCTGERCSAPLPRLGNKLCEYNGGVGFGAWPSLAEPLLWPTCWPGCWVTTWVQLPLVEVCLRLNGRTRQNPERFTAVLNASKVMSCAVGGSILQCAVQPGCQGSKRHLRVYNSLCVHCPCLLRLALYLNISSPLHGLLHCAVCCGLHLQHHPQAVQAYPQHPCRTAPGPQPVLGLLLVPPALPAACMGPLHQWRAWLLEHGEQQQLEHAQVSSVAYTCYAVPCRASPACIVTDTQVSTVTNLPPIHLSFAVSLCPLNATATIAASLGEGQV